MLRLSRLVVCLLTLQLFQLATEAHADIIIDATVGGGQVGGYYGEYTTLDDVPGGYPPTLAPDIDPISQVYFLGRSTFPLLPTPTTPERRAYFIFDPSGIVIPAGEEIVGVTLSLELLFGGVLANFATGGMEVVEFGPTPFGPDEILRTVVTPPDPIDIWDTFGDGSYGGFVIFGAGSPTPSMADVYTIPLPGALTDVKDAVAIGSEIIITARLATFDPDPIGMGATAVDPFEFVFGLTDVHAAPPGADVIPKLTLITIPEPNSALLLCMVSMIAAANRYVSNRR